MYSSNAKYGSGISCETPLSDRERERGHKIRLFDKTTGNMNEECCGSREEGQANDIPATLVVVYYIRPLKKMRPQVIISA